jgi:hypothetical protein
MLFRRREDLDAEIRAHLEHEEGELRAGTGDDEARRQARLRFGSVSEAHERRERAHRQILTESALLAVTGGLAGLALAAGWFVCSRPTPRRRCRSRSSSTGRMASVSSALAVAACLVVGTAPALQAARVQVLAALTNDAHTAARAGRRVELSPGEAAAFGLVGWLPLPPFGLGNVRPQVVLREDYEAGMVSQVSAINVAASTISVTASRLAAGYRAPSGVQLSATLMVAGGWVRASLKRKRAPSRVTAKPVVPRG